MITVWIPPAWLPYTRADYVQVEVADVRGMASTLAGLFPHLQHWLFEPDGNLKRWINVYVNGQDIRLLMDADTPLRPTDDVRIILAVAGG